MIAPTTEDGVARAVAEALEAGTPITIAGGGTRAGLARPVQSDVTLDLSGLSGITLHEPAEMVIGAWAGTPLSEIEAALDKHNQMLAFEPADYRAVLGSSGEPTIGAVVAGNISGPRRVLSGAARDSLIGVRFVNGRAEIIKSGGRVMKNVTGLDLVKLQAGAWGTLGVLTEVIFKVTPKPPEGRTLVVDGLADDEAITLLGKAMGTAFEVNGAAHLPAGLHGSNARTLMRIEGFPEQLDYRMSALSKALGVSETVLIDDAHADVWQMIRDIQPFALQGSADSAPALWRISCPAMAGASIVEAIAQTRPVRALYDWSGGLVWLETASSDDAGAGAIRAACEDHSGGHATLVRAPVAVKATVPVFHPLDDAHMALTRQIKASLDPKGVFNPGAIYAGL